MNALGIDGFPLASPPDEDTHRRIDALLVEANAEANAEETAAAFEQRVASFLPLMLDRVELHRAVARRLAFYEGRDVGWRTLQTVRRLYEVTFPEVKSFLDDADLVQALSVARRTDLSFKEQATPAALVDAIVTLAKRRVLGAALVSALGGFLEHLHACSGSKGMIGRIEKLLGRASEVDAPELPDDVVDDVLSQVADGYDGPLAVYASAAEQHDDVDPGVLEAFVAEAFARKARDAESWPATTDCDRISHAFAVIRAQGIIALEYAGFTKQMAQAAAIDLSLARDDAGTPDIGFCYFTLQDVWSAREGRGLMIGYSAFHEPEEENSRKIATVVVEACRAAGLEVNWSGATDDRIDLPKLDWKRRGDRISLEEVELLMATLDVELLADATTIEEAVERLSGLARTWFSDRVDFGPTQLAALETRLRADFEAEVERETSWTAPTMNDRITVALASLRNLVVLEDQGLNIQDGWGYVRGERTDAHRGAVFYHHEDTIDGVEDRGLRLAFGTFELDRVTNDAATRALGHEIVATLLEHGVPARWSGLVTERIEILPFAWRKRRFTSAPAVTPTPIAVPGSVAPALIDPAWRRAIVERGHARVEIAPARAGFDLRRSRALRAAWRAVSGSDDGHACTLNRPMVFTRAGEYLAFGAMSARENIREEAVAYYTKNAVGVEDAHAQG